MSFWGSIIKSSQILGMNARNLEYLRPSNLKSAKRIADNKLLAKALLADNGLPVPKTFAVIKSAKNLHNFDPATLPKSFVLKPNRGLGGEGILLTYNQKRNGAWLDNNLKEISWVDIKAHVQDILDGRFSLSNKPDTAFFEERLVKESMFKHLAYRGVPDIRLIIYNQVPVMAMMRLPTKKSQGKANLHLGGIGVGIDIGSGCTTYAICEDKILTGAHSYSGIKIPDWEQILRLAISAQQISRLGYLGVDLVLAKNIGPVILELNARPGLSIQIANLAPLKERLERIRGVEVDSPERGIRIARDLFASKQSAEPAALADHSTLKVIETVWLYHRSDLNIKVPLKAKIDSGARSSSLDYELGRELGYGDVVDFLKSFDLDRPMQRDKALRFRRRLKKELKLHRAVSSVKLINSASGSSVRVTVPITFKLKGKLIKTDVNLISRETMTYPMIVGRRDLEGFLLKLRNSN